MKDKFYITTPIYYPSGRYHIGTAYTTVLADTIKRYEELRGKDTFMLTGADEHGQKIETKAKEAGVTPQQYVDKMADMAKELWTKMDIQYNDLWRKEISIKESMKDYIVFHVKHFLQKHN